MLAWVFPGQGSHAANMGRDLRTPAAAEVFASARKILGWDPRAIAREAPKLLADTRYAQPAIFTVSVAAARTLEAHRIFPDAVAGHSLGEFAALVAAGALLFEEALVAVVARANAMAAAGEARRGAMAAILGLDEHSAGALCAAMPGTVVIANVNGPSQTVVAGDESAIKHLDGAVRSAGGRVHHLEVSVAAHSPLMEPACAPLRDALDAATLMDPLVPFVDGATATVHTTADHLIDHLVNAVVHPVRWIDCVQRLRALGASVFVEAGPGNVLSGLNRRIDATLHTEPLGDDETIHAFTSSLQTIGHRA